MAISSPDGRATRARAADRSARLNSALVQATSDGICVLDADGTITYVNLAFSTMTGFAADDLIGGSAPRPFWPQESRQSLSAMLKRALSGAEHEFDLVYCRLDGERFPVRLTMAPVAADGGTGEGFVCVMREVTREVRERDWLREAHSAARLVSWEYDPRSGRVTVSGALAALRGVHVAEGASLETLLALFEEPHGRQLRASLKRVSAGEGDAILEGRLVRSDPSLERADMLPQPRWVETRMHPVRDVQGRITAVRGTSQDITARKLAEVAGLQSEERLRQAQRLAEIGSFEVDEESGKVTWSPELYRLFGVNSDTFSHDLADMLSMFPPDDSSALRALFAETLKDGRARDCEHHYRRGSELRSAETRIEAWGQAGAGRGVRGTMQDITDRRRAEGEIRLQARLLDAVDVAVIATDLDGTITHWNRGAERLYSQPREATVGRTSVSLTASAEQAAETQALIDRVIALGQADSEFDMAGSDGTTRRVGFHTTLFRDRAGDPVGIVGVSADITAKLEYERSLLAARDYQRAITDSMTEGLYTLDPEGRLIYINRAAQDMLGWEHDELLGRVMHDVVHFRRADGTPAPADECPLRAPCASGASVRIADDILIRKDGAELPVEINSAPFETGDGIIGSVVVFTDTSERKRAERRMLSDADAVSRFGQVRDALADERFVVHAQPIVDIATRAVVRHELLIRMLDESGELIMPGQFLPAAEKYGLVADIDRWMLGQAVELAAEGHAVAVNLSAYSVAAPRLLSDYLAALRRTGADPSLIVVELTETALLEDGPAAERLINGIRAAGSHLAIDDFGTGYGGFTYLKQLPFDFLKIDAEFVRDLTENAASRHVVCALISLAKGFGQKTIAEGVEDEATLAMLGELGVDFAQGYVIARPAPAAEVLVHAEAPDG
jgi:PAS domain S-box-containing protein